MLHQLPHNARNLLKARRQLLAKDAHQRTQTLGGTCQERCQRRVSILLVKTISNSKHSL
jgi:hypothetical protein